MDATLSNVLEGARQYFLGVPKPAQNEGSGQTVWPAGVPPPEEGTPAQSGAPATQSRPPSAAAAPPVTPIPPPPRPPSEPLEPEPHIIHKATVMREALEKRREQPEPDEEDEETNVALSPPSHFIRKPPAAVPSPAPAPAAPCPSPARPPSSAPELNQDQPSMVHNHSQASQSQRTPDTYKSSRPPEKFTPTRLSESYSTGRPPDNIIHRPPDPYPGSRPPDLHVASRFPESYAAAQATEHYQRYQYETSADSGRSSRGPPTAMIQPSALSRHSPQQTYARISSTMPVHNRSREPQKSNTHARYSVGPTMAPSMPPNDRVPPLHHPNPSSASLSRSMPAYPSTHPSREPSPYARVPTSYDRHIATAPRKYDHQQSYSGYRPTTSYYPSGHRVEPQKGLYKQTPDNHNVQYTRGLSVSNNNSNIPSRLEYGVQNRLQDSRSIVESRQPLDSRNIADSRSAIIDQRNGHNYSNPSSSTSRYLSNATVPVHQNATVPPKTLYPPSTTSYPSYEYPATNIMQTSPARPTAKSGIINQQARMTVSVTSLVNQMNQTKHKRESPLDLSVKTVKHSADSSTTQDDVIDSVSAEHKIVLPQQRATNSRASSVTSAMPSTGQVTSHKVDFAPDFQSQYVSRERVQIYNNDVSQSRPYNGVVQAEPRSSMSIDQYPVPSRHINNLERSRYSNVPTKHDVPQIDLTRPVHEERHSETKLHDDRNYPGSDRKRLNGPIVNNIPEKSLRYENWPAESRIDLVHKLDRSAREQQELMSQPVYSYSSHKRLEAYQNEQKKQALATLYRDPHTQVDSRVSYVPEPSRLSADYNVHHHGDRNQPSSRHVVQKITNHRDVHHHYYHHHHHLDHNSGIPADKRVLSILRNSLETKQVGLVDTPKQAKEIPDLIVIDDADDAVIEITDLTKENSDTHLKAKIQEKLRSPGLLSQTIHIPRAVDSIASDFDNHPRGVIDKSPENDVASRIRTKAELKVMPPSEENILGTENKLSGISDPNTKKLVPKSQKQHLFNQIRKDNLRMESVIKNEINARPVIPEIKTEPMNIDEIEKDAEIPIKTEDCLILSKLEDNPPADDLDWTSACDSFVEQLKSGCHKKKLKKRRIDSEIEIKTEPNLSIEDELNNKITPDDKNKCNEINAIAKAPTDSQSKCLLDNVVIKQEPKDEDDITNYLTSSLLPMKDNKPNLEIVSDIPVNNIETSKSPEKEGKISKNKQEKANLTEKCSKEVVRANNKNNKLDESEEKSIKKMRKNKFLKARDASKLKIDSKINNVKIKTKTKDKATKPKIKEESESTDDDEPLIKSKILKEKEKSDRMKYQLLKDLSEKSAYVKLECCEKVNRKSLDSLPVLKEKEPKLKLTRQLSRSKTKSLSNDVNRGDNKKANSSSSNSDSDDISVASRLRLRKSIKVEDSNLMECPKTPQKSVAAKKQETNSTPIQKTGFGDGSGFHPGWEEELYKYKRSLRMPSKLIAIPRGRSGGPYPRSSAGLFNRGSTSLPDLDPAPLSPAPSSVPSAATDDLYTRRQEKIAIDSDLDSNSSYSATYKLHYDSEASTSTIFSKNIKKKEGSIVDVLIQKCGKPADTKKKCKDKLKDDVTTKKSIISELPVTPSVEPLKTLQNKLSVKKEKSIAELCSLEKIKKEKLSAIRGVTGKHKIVELLSGSGGQRKRLKSRTDNKTSKHRATIKEVFGDEKPASAPSSNEDDTKETEAIVKAKKELDLKVKLNAKKIQKDKLKRRSNSIREGLRSTMSLKRNDAKGRLLRLKKRNNILKNLADKKGKDFTNNKPKKSKSPSPDQKLSEIKIEKTDELSEAQGKKKFKRLFGRRKFSSGFDYIRKKKKIIRNDGQVIKKIRRAAFKPNPESIHDIQKEIKGWFINKSVGETLLHRAARLGYSDCVAYCLEKMELDPSAKDNAGFTPLHVASAKGYVFIGRLLLQYGANVSAAAQGGIRPLHEAAENNNIEMIRLLLSYGADPILGTYAGQTPEELAEGNAATLLKLHIADVQGQAQEPWHFPLLSQVLNESGCNPLSSPPPATPPPPPDSTIEIQCTDAPLPPFYSLRAAPGQPAEGLWCLMQDLTSFLQIKSKESLLKQIHCGSGSPKELFREIKTPEFLERAQCHQLLCAGEKVNVRASKVALVRVTDKLRQLLKVETVLVS